MWLHAADPDGFGLWKGETIGTGKQLASKIDDQKFAFLSLGTYQNHLMGLLIVKATVALNFTRLKRMSWS